jgi:hypothetical protein
MKRAGSVVLSLMVTAMLGLLVGLSQPGWAGERTDPAGAEMKSLLEDARKDSEKRNSVRIEVEGQLGADLNQITIYGRGIGIWNGEKQFTADSKAVDQAIGLLLGAKFYELPDRFAYEEKKDEKEIERQKPVKLVRIVTVSVGTLSKTVVQDNKGPHSKPFETMTTELVELCKKPAEEGITAVSLEDGLQKVVDGSLAPEALWVSVNAPQLKSLESQDGQGWLLEFRHGILSLRSNILGQGIRDTGERRLTAREAQTLAKQLLGAGLAEMPQNINTAGYTQLAVAVLNHKKKILARQFASPPDEDAKAAEKSFASLRKELFELYESGAGN